MVFSVTAACICRRKPENIAKDVNEQSHERDSLLLLAAAPFQERSDIKIMDEPGDGIRNFLLITGNRWYNRHGATSPMGYWFFVESIIPEERAGGLFYRLNY